ncbi:MAG: hypothetical protein NVS4B11_00440 [Ktedonobacteraceae bacterium]
MREPYNIELHIEELVLHGFSSADRHAIGEAVQRELTRLLTEQGIHPAMTQGHEAARVKGGTFNMQQGAKADTVGTQVAQSVYGGLRK